MPKPMTMTVQVEEIAFGRVFRMLDGTSGVVAINITGSGPKPAAPGPRSKKQGAWQNGTTVPQLVLAALASGKVLEKADLAPPVIAGGRKATSIPDALQTLRKKKLVTAIGNGKYKITKSGVAVVAAAKEKTNGKG